MASYKEMVKEYRKLAKRADQRMVRLEALAHEKDFRHVKEWAYSKAAFEIEQYTGKLKKGQAPRWNRGTPKDKKTLERKINDIRTFLESPTSTRKGIEKTYKSRVNTINEQYGTKFKWSDFARLTDSNLFDSLKDNYGSSTTFEIIATMQKDKEKLKQLLDESNKKNEKIDPESLDYGMILQDAISKELNKDGLSLLDLL